MVFGPNLLQWICREWVQKLDSDEAIACFGDAKHTESGGPTSQGEGTPCSRTGMRQPLLVTQEPPSCFWASLSFLAVPLFCEISVVIYPPLLFILLLHLSVIHVHSLVHVPLAILSGALWAAVAPIALSRGHIHINGVKVSAVGI